MYEIFELLLRQNHVTTYQVAKATGISTASFTGWKQGKWNFKADKLQKIADYFGVSVDYLLTGEETKKEASTGMFKYDIFQKLCDSSHITPYKVCKETGITTATISNWKAGRYTPKANKLKKIADFFGVSVDFLMTNGETDADEDDLHDIKNSVDFIMRSLDSETTLCYGGIEIELTGKNREVLRSAINIIKTTLEDETK